MNMKKVAEKFRLLRQEKKLSQQYVADSLNVSVSTISRVENNPEDIKLCYFYRIAAFYKIDIGKIFSNDEKRDLDEQLSKITINVAIPFHMTADQLFRVAKELQKREQEK